MSYFDISSIGNNPYMMSPLGAVGLTSGGFGSYGMNPAMMGMPGGMGMAGGFGMAGAYPGFGMYNPTFMKQMTETMHDMEKDQLSHAGAMHNLMLDNQVNAYRDHDEMMFKKSMEDSSVQGLVDNLHVMIQKGDADGICQEYDKLKCAILTKYADYLNQNVDRIDPKIAIRNHIEDIYAAIISAKTGEQVSLKNDIKRYGETAFMHGFNRDFLGNGGYHDKYTEETLSYLFDTRIDSKDRKDRLEQMGGYAGRAAEGLTAAGVGYGAGVAATGLAALFSKSVRNKLVSSRVKNEAGKVVKDQAGKAIKNKSFMNGLKKAGKIGKWVALATLAADVVWQCSRD